MKTVFIALLALVFSLNAHAQIITTIAGNDTAGYTGDGGPATAARITPGTMVVDFNKNIYISQHTGVIRKVNAAGIISTYAGVDTLGFSGDGGPATAAKFGNIAFMAVDRKGNLFFSDISNQRIRKINTAGIITTVVGDGTGTLHLGGPATACGIGGSRGICCDDTGNLYLYTQYRILKVDTFGIITFYAGSGVGGFAGDGGLADTAKFNGVEGLAMDKDHNLYVAELVYVRRVSASRMVSTFASKYGIGGGLATGDGGPATAARFSQIYEISPDRCGNLYIGDPLNNRVRVVNGGGYVNTFAGTGYGGTGNPVFTGGHTGDGGPASAARLYGPVGVFVDEEGGIYIRDAYNLVIRYIHMDSCKNTTGVASPRPSPGEREELSVYPNPSNGAITLNLSSPINEPANVVITNIMGAQVMAYTTSTNKETEINLHVAMGMYFVCVSTERGKWVRKVVVE